MVETIISQAETFEERVKSVAAATGIGALTGAILSKIVTTVKDIPIHLQAAKIRKIFPQMTQADAVEIVRVIKEGRLISLKFDKPVSVARRIAPKGFRLGSADIEKPIKLAGKIAKKAARTKEATIVEAAKAVFAVKTQPAKAVKPTVVITKADAAGLKEIGALGEGEKLRIVANPQLKKSIQAAENEIAQLKTRRDVLKAEKQFAVVKTKAQEIAKKEIALATLKEKASIRLETTIEGFKGKIDKCAQYAVSSGDPMPLREVVELFEKVKGRPLPVQWGKRPYRKREVMVPWNRGEKLPGWEPKISLSEGMSHI